MNNMSDEVRNNFRQLLCELSDVMEGGDVALDFEGYPAFVAIIESINAIVKHNLSGMFEADKFNKLLKELLE
tara:strand:- start:3749 stop:3964 length:216 start_codon:yes stop_codon:yes gene_type:complete